MNPVRKSKIIFLLSVLTAVFWCLGQLINVYKFGILGAAFELLWLPMIVLLFILPVLSFIQWMKEKFSPKSLYLYSFLLILATGMFMFLKN